MSENRKRQYGQGLEGFEERRKRNAKNLHRVRMARNEAGGGSGMSNITVDPQEVVVWLAFSDGWKKASGFVVTIQGVKFSFVPYNNACPKLLISELSSGSKCVEIDFSIIDFINSSTKEGTIQVFSEYATKFSECIDSNLRKQIITQSARQKKEHESKFGKIPEVVPFDLEGWAEDAANE